MESEYRLKLGSEFGASNSYVLVTIKLRGEVSKQEHEYLGTALRTISDVASNFKEDK